MNKKLKIENKINLIIDVDLLGLGFVHDKARTGVFRVTEELLKRLLLNKNLNVTLSSCNNLYDSLRFLDHANIKRNTNFIHSEKVLKRTKSLVKIGSYFDNFTLLSKIYRKIVYEIFLPKELEFKKALPENPIYFSSYSKIPDFIKGNLEIKKVLLIHDLIAFKLPELFEDSNRMDVSKSISSADENTTFVCVSKSTKNDLQRFFPKLKNKKRVVYLAASREMFYQVQNKAKIDYTLRKYGIPNKPYLLSLSTLEPRKNIETTIKAFIKLLKEHHEINASLVLVGTLGWQYKSIFDEIMNSGNIKNQVIITGYVDDCDLAAIYSGATGFIYPSLYEGFGLPPLEAMQCGVPVVVSNTSSMPEVVGDAGIYVEPLDKVGIKNAMDKLLTDRVFNQELSENSLSRALEFSWAKSVDSYVNIFKNIHKNN